MKKVTKLEPSAPAIRPRKRVAAYARISKETERMNHSLSAQVSYYNEMIQKNSDWLFAGRKHRRYTSNALNPRCGAWFDLGRKLQRSGNEKALSGNAGL